MFTFDAPQGFMSGKTIAITGASDGIGKCCAEHFASLGAHLILFGRSQEKLEALFDDIEQKHPGLVTIQPLDFVKAGPDDYQLIGESLINSVESLDGLIHCAGLLGARTPVEFYPSDEWDRVMDANVNGPFRLTKALLPALKASSDARLLFLSSSVGRKGRAYWGAYAASKFALEGLMQVLAEELGATSNIKVNSLNPGGTRTAMRRAAYPAEDPNTVPECSSLMPLFGYLFSPGAAAMHGQAINARDFDPGNYLQASSES